MRRSMVDFQPQIVVRLQDRQLRLPGENLPETALMPGKQMLDENDRHPGIDREMLQQFPKRLQPAGRSAHADDRKRTLLRRLAGALLSRCSGALV